jgi:hypothetical protein
MSLKLFSAYVVPKRTASFAPRLTLMAEILALRQQLASLNRTAKRPSFWDDGRILRLYIRPALKIESRFCQN